MLVYLVIFEYMTYSPHPQISIKQIHRTVPTTLDNLMQRNLYLDYPELFKEGSKCQWEIVYRPDNAHLEELAKKESK